MKKLYVRAECNVNDSGYDMFYITGAGLFDDGDVSKELNISLEKYWSILIKYGAVEIDTYEPMFNTYEEAQACIDYLNQGTYIEDTLCSCECDNNESDFEGCEGVYHDKKTNKWYFVIEHFRGERNKAEIDYCPYCGRHLT